MARIAGVTLPEEKRIDIGLTAIYGIGRGNVSAVLRKAKVDSAKKVADLTAQEVTRLAKAIDTIPVEGTLKKQVTENIKRLVSIGTYRGIRHSKGLPVRGQRTRSNARTKRGGRKTIGAMRKKDQARFATTQKSRGEDQAVGKQGEEK